jgi:hypothetical protein
MSRLQPAVSTASHGLATEFIVQIAFLGRVAVRLHTRVKVPSRLKRLTSRKVHKSLKRLKSS